MDLVFQGEFLKHCICYEDNASPSGKRKTVLLQWHIFVIWDDISFQSLDFVCVIIIKPQIFGILNCRQTQFNRGMQTITFLVVFIIT